MPYKVENRAAECPAGKPWAVVARDTGKVLAAQASEEAAMSAMRARAMGAHGLFKLRVEKGRLHVTLRKGELVEISKPYPNEHACRLANPDDYESMRRNNNRMQHDGKRMDVIFGRRKDGKSEIQAIRYPKDTWTAEAARTNCESHKGSFEVAKE